MSDMDNINEVDIVNLMIELGINIDKAKIIYDQDFAEIGLDSLDRASLYLGVVEKYGIEIAEKDLDQLSSVSAVVIYTRGKILG